MKRLSPIWFLKHPLDPEYKSYIILEHIKEQNEEIEKNKIDNTMKEILRIIRDLNTYKKLKTLPIETIESLTKEERSLFKLRLDETEEDVISSIKETIDTSLDILYKYASTIMGMIEERKSKLKTFEILPPGGFKEQPRFGFFFIRNLTTDRVIPYFWSENYMMGEDRREGIMIKKIRSTTDKQYSMSYISIAHEIIEESGIIDKMETPRIFVCEISENFQDDSDLIKLAKDSLIEKLSREKERRD